jgi:hypothetical protein
MIDYVAVFLLGAITIVIPLVAVYIRIIGTKYIVECQKARADLDQMLINLNSLHNSAVAKYSSMDGRLMKVETTIQATNYGKAMK